jgi:hypothetical protein
VSLTTTPLSSLPSGKRVLATQAPFSPTAGNSVLTGEALPTVSARDGGFGPDSLFVPVDADSTDVAQQTHAAATITKDATAGRYVLYALTAGYNTNPSAPGTLVVKSGTSTVLSLPVVAAGPVRVNLPQGGLAMATGDSLTVSLSDGGSNVVGTVSIVHRLLV